MRTSSVSAAIDPRDFAPQARSGRVLGGRACALAVLLCVSAIAPAAERAARANYTLKLDYEMTREGGAPASRAPVSPAASFGIADLNERAVAADERVKVLEQDNQKWQTELSAREGLIGELEQALESQEQTIRLLEKKVLEPPPPPLPTSAVPAGVRTWGPAGWDPRALGWTDVRNFMDSPSAVERALSLVVVLLLFYALFQSLRRRESLPEPEPYRDRGTASTQRVEPRRDAPVVQPQRPPTVQPEEDRAPPEPDLNVPQAPDDSPPTIRLAVGNPMQGTSEVAAPPAQASPDATSSPRPRRKRADVATLREVDALIAFEHFDDAAEVLAQAMLDNPDNPEYRLRSLYILNALGDHERIASEQSILRAIMDGPMSDTLGRVITTGRGLLPGHPLFEAKDTVAPSTPQESLPDDELTLDDGSIDEFNELTSIWKTWSLMTSSSMTSNPMKSRPRSD